MIRFILPMLLGSTTAVAQDAEPAPVAVSGVIFSSFGVDFTDAPTSAFDVDRVYLTYKKKIGDDFGIRVTTDAGRTTEDDGKQRLFVKYAYAEWKNALPGTTLRFGAAGMPFPGYYDKFWGHRYVSMAFTDANKLLRTSDFGMHALGKTSGGLFDWQVSLVNGEGYGVEEPDADKAVVARATIDPLRGGDAGRLPITLTVFQDVLTDNPRTLYGAATGFSNANTTAWVEYVGTLQADVTGTGLSATLLQGIGPVNILARYDFLDEDTGTTDDAETTLIAGLSGAVEKGIELALTFEQTVSEADTDNPEQGVFLRTQAKF